MLAAKCGSGKRVSEPVCDIKCRSRSPFLEPQRGVLFASAPLHDQPARLPTLDVDRAVAIAVALWQWQEAKLRATLRNDRSVSRRSALTPLIPLLFRSRCGRLSESSD